KAPIVFLEYRILCRQIERIAALERIIHRGAREIADRGVEIVHRHDDAAARRLEHFPLDQLALIADVLEAKRALGRKFKFGGTILVGVRVAPDDDRLRPARYQARHILADNGLAKDDAPQDVADGAVGAAPHLFEPEFLDARLVRRDGG